MSSSALGLPLLYLLRSFGRKKEDTYEQDLGGFDGAQPHAGAKSTDPAVGAVSRSTDPAVDAISQSKDLAMGTIAKSKDPSMGKISKSKELAMGTIAEGPEDHAAAARLNQAQVRKQDAY